MKTQILFLMLVIIVSCNKEEQSSYKITVVNNSSHTIKIKPFSFEYIKGSDSAVLQPNDREVIMDFSERGDSGPLANANISTPDTIAVTYNDTLTVYHNCWCYTMNRDLKRVSSYTGGEKQVTKKNVSYYYEYEYEFTNADFEEAKTK